MKVTLDLPPSLVKQVKLRALNDGKKLKDAVADLLQRGMAADGFEDGPSGTGRRRKRVNLPVIKCKHAATPQDAMTPERVAKILADQEVEWHHAASR